MQKDCPTQKSLPAMQIDFTPQNEIEKIHLAMINDLLRQKRHGDWGLVGEIMQCSAQAAEKSFKRVYSKSHLQAVAALESIINNRKKLLQN